MYLISYLHDLENGPGPLELVQANTQNSTEVHRLKLAQTGTHLQNKLSGLMSLTVAKGTSKLKHKWSSPQVIITKSFKDPF